ncbi:MAG TPA: aminotransferase class III-fold pyridoxal phosphate-dependent enzyme [Steroidobacteraceae bacterium]|nr:aminotransferase class III-fold pyridoxal phosphate-dependent enzyme [Steroidobacteraceae bacterium]
MSSSEPSSAWGRSRSWASSRNRFWLRAGSWCRGEALCAHARELAPYFQQRLRELDGLPIVGEVRGMGLLAGVEFVIDRRSKKSFAPEVGIGRRIAAACRIRGVIVRALGNTVGISPPLIVTREHVDTLVDVLRESIHAVIDELVKSGTRIDA